MKRLSYNQVKQSFEAEGYTLLSQVYINSRHILEFICPNGHHHSIKYDYWHGGCRCKYCSKYGNKLTIDFVRQSFEAEGYTLLSTEYLRAHDYLYFICPNGYKHKIEWASWQQGRRCPCDKCGKNNKTSKQERELQDFVKETHTGIVLTNDRSLIQNPLTGEFLELDIWMPDIMKAIEYGAERWHSGKYSKYKDGIKQKYCKDNGIDLMVIDHKKWIRNKDWNMIKEFINN